MIIELWNEFLYRPLLNLLVWVYNNWTEMSMGWAIIYLTILLRLVLLPFTVMTELNKSKNKVLVDEIKRIEKLYKKDKVMQKQEIRRLMKHKKVRPWSSVFVLGIQVLVLVLLYQVFTAGIGGEQIHILRALYTGIDFPGVINTQFWFGDMAATGNLMWAAIVVALLMLFIYDEFRKYKVKLSKGDFNYFILFPLASGVVLYILPMVKSIFIFVSLVFSFVISYILQLVIKPEVPESEKAGAKTSSSKK